MIRTENPIANPDAVLREEFDDWAVLFNPDTADAVGINPVGVAVWNLLDGHHSVGQITATIAEDFADMPESASQDIDAFVQDLARRGFVGYELDGSDR